MKIIKKILVMALFISTGFVCLSAEAAEKKKATSMNALRAGTCPDIPLPKVSMEKRTGRLYLNNNKPSIVIAREKSKKYNIQMPLSQGNMGRSIFRTHIQVKLANYPAMSCVVVKSIDVDVYVDQKLDIANEHEEKSCVYEELYILEMELLAQDEDMMYEDFELFTDVLKEGPGQHAPYRRTNNLNVNKVLSNKREEIESAIEDHLDVLEDRLFDLRMETDLAEYYDEILEECADR